MRLTQLDPHPGGKAGGFPSVGQGESSTLEPFGWVPMPHQSELTRPRMRRWLLLGRFLLLLEALLYLPSLMWMIGRPKN